MTPQRISLALLLALLCFATFTNGQSPDPRKLDDLRKRYHEGMYIADQSLNNLNVHLRANETTISLLKSGVNEDALNVFRKFLVDRANDRAFLQLELHRLRALFKRHNDTSANIQQLPWSQTQVFHIAVLCDKYLQGQLILVQLRQRLANNGISVGDGWMTLEELRKDPFVPGITMTESLKGLIVHVERNQTELEALAGTNPALSAKIKSFKYYATDASVPNNAHMPFEWPSVVKSEWIKRYKLIESYGKSTDSGAAILWQKQLDNLQELEFSQLVRASQKPD